MSVIDVAIGLIGHDKFDGILSGVILRFAARCRFKNDRQSCRDKFIARMVRLCDGVSHYSYVKVSTGGLVKKKPLKPSRTTIRSDRNVAYLLGNRGRKGCDSGR